MGKGGKSRVGRITYFDNVPEELKSSIHSLGAIFVERAYETAKGFPPEAVYLIEHPIGADARAVGYFSWDGKVAPELSGISGFRGTNGILPLFDEETGRRYVALETGFFTGKEISEAGDRVLLERIACDIVLSRETPLKKYASNVKY